MAAGPPLQVARPKTRVPVAACKSGRWCSLVVFLALPFGRHAQCLASQTPESQIKLGKGVLRVNINLVKYSASAPATFRVTHDQMQVSDWRIFESDCSMSSWKKREMSYNSSSFLDPKQSNAATLGPGVVPGFLNKQSAWLECVQQTGITLWWWWTLVRNSGFSTHQPWTLDLTPT